MYGNWSLMTCMSLQKKENCILCDIRRQQLRTKRERGLLMPAIGRHRAAETASKSQWFGERIKLAYKVLILPILEWKVCFQTLSLDNSDGRRSNQQTCKGDKSTSGLLQFFLDPSIMFRIKVPCTCTSRLMALVDAERLSFLTQTKWLFVGANLKRNFSYLKAKTRSLSPVTWKQPSNLRSFISRRNRWCFTALCWTRAVIA